MDSLATSCSSYSAVYKKREIRNIILDLFSHVDCTKLSKDKKVIISLFMQGDGKGDLSHGKEMLKRARKILPQAKFDLVIMAHPYHKSTPLPLPESDKCTSHVIYSKSGENQEHFDSPILQNIKESDLVIEASWPINEINFNKLREQNFYGKNQKAFQVDEYDWENAVSYSHFQLHMGLSPTSHGILLPKNSSSSLIEIENSSLKQILFNSSNPRESDLEHYKASTNFHFAYMNDNNGPFKKTFIYLLVAEQEGDSKNIDLCTSIKNFDDLDKNYLIEKKIGQVEVVTLKNGKLETETISLQKEGKTLRFINVFPFKHNDILTMIASSDHFVAGRGDCTFSEIISAHYRSDQVPLLWYEIIPIKRKLWGEVIAIAQERFGGDAPLVQYFNEIKSIYYCPDRNSTIKDEFDAFCKEKAQNILLHIQNPKIFQQMREFYKYVQNELSFENYFKGAVNYFIVKRCDPTISEFFEEIIAKYSNKELTEFKESLQKLSTQLNQKDVSPNDLKDQIKQIWEQCKPVRPWEQYKPVLPTLPILPTLPVRPQGCLGDFEVYGRINHPDEIIYKNIQQLVNKIAKECQNDKEYDRFENFAEGLLEPLMLEQMTADEIFLALENYKRC